MYQDFDDQTKYSSEGKEKVRGPDDFSASDFKNDCQQPLLLKVQMDTTSKSISAQYSPRHTESKDHTTNEENSAGQPLTIHQVGFVNFDENEEATCLKSITLLEFCPCFTYLVLPLLSVLSLLILPLFTFWMPSLRARLMYSKVTKLEQASHVLVEGLEGNLEICELYCQQNQDDPKDTFTYRFIQFELDRDERIFKPIMFQVAMRHAQLLEKFSSGISDQEHEVALNRYGPCQIVVPRKPIPLLLIDEVLNPFYLFQVFSMILWFNDGYQKYAVCILVVSLLGVGESLYETLTNVNSIRKMAMYECDVEVLRRDEAGHIQRKTTSSNDLVPGDVLVVPENAIMPCDGVLLSGSCIVNESMLTGESVPVIKNAVQATDDYYDPKDNDKAKKYTLFSGTKVIQARKTTDSPVIAVVSRTGFVTTKGTLVRDILYPKETKFQFYRDSLIFVGAMALVGIIGFVTTIPTLLAQGATTPVLIDKSLDLLTVTVPPALPATMSAGVAFAVARLKKQQIYCISPPRVNLSGRVQIFVFDKTGTLTEDGLQILGLRGVLGRLKEAMPSFTDFVDNIKRLVSSQDGDDECDRRQILNQVMASCHSITYVQDELVGDPLEIKMFESTKWQLDEQCAATNSLLANDEVVLAYVKPPMGRGASQEFQSYEPEAAAAGQNARGGELAIIRRFDFESKLMRMSVIVKNTGTGRIWSFVKGSPEKIQELCVPESIPADFDVVLDEYTRKGYRVIALAARQLDASVSYLDVQNWSRDRFERDLQFLGFLVMENKLKDATRETITVLNECNIRTIMATGDNTLTAISVGRGCGILDEEANVYFGDVEDGHVVWKGARGEVLDESVDSKLALHPANYQVEDEYTQVPWELEEEGTENYGVALNGKTLHFLSQNKQQYEPVLNKVLMKAQVYARMSPDDKATLVELLQDTMQVQIGMCGDGANDCGALKQADAGISLSEAEASIAAPFTSKIQDISCVITLLREGRAALTTTFQAFKFIELYSMIQFFSVTLLYLQGSNLSDNQFLYIDIGVLVPLCIFQSWTGAYHKLTRNLPQESLFSPPVIISVLGSAAIQFAFQFYCYKTIKDKLGEEFVKCVQSTSVEDDDPPCSQNSVIYLISCQQYIITCLCFSIAKPFRKPIWSNPLFLVCVILMGVYQTYLMIHLDDTSKRIFALVPFPMDYRYELLIVFGLNALLSYIFEKCFIGWFAAFYQKRQQIQKKDRLAKNIRLSTNTRQSQLNLTERGLNQNISDSNRSTSIKRKYLLDMHEKNAFTMADQTGDQEDFVRADKFAENKHAKDDII